MTRLLSVVVCLLAATSLALAQGPAPAPLAKLIVTVVDQTGGVIPTANVTIAGLDDATKLPVATPVRTSDKGLATFDSLKPGRYAISADFAGFDPNTLKDVRLKAGDNKHVIVLALKKIQDSVTVRQDTQVAGSNRDVLFGSALTR